MFNFALTELKTFFTTFKQVLYNQNIKFPISVIFVSVYSMCVKKCMLSIILIQNIFFSKNKTFHFKTKIFLNFHKIKLTYIENNSTTLQWSTVMKSYETKRHVTSKNTNFALTILFGFVQKINNWTKHLTFMLTSKHIPR